MGKRACDGCGEPINLRREDARTCSPRCRKRVSRLTFPEALTSRDRWLRRDAGKRPLTVSGRAGSSTNSRTWASFAVARASSEGVGLGYVLGDGIGCWDFDHCLEDGVLAGWAREAIDAIPQPVVFAEVSQSGHGVHVFVEAPEGKGRVVRDGRNIEFYPSGRYIAVTGRPFKI